MIMNFIPHLSFIVLPSLILVTVLILTEQALIPAQKPASPSCFERKCGGISIPFPFGIKSKCSFDDRFTIICNTSLSPPKPFLKIANNYLEVIEISVKDSTLRVNSPIFSNCPENARTSSLNLSKSPFMFSSTANIFASVGCDNTAFLMGEDGNMISGCLTYCANTPRISSSSSPSPSCHGQECCQTRIPWQLDVVDMHFKKAGTCESQRSTDKCIYALIAEEKWVDYSLNLTSFAIKQRKQVPAVLEWSMYINNGSCTVSDDQTIINKVRFCAPTNAHCSPRSNDQRVICLCDEGYEGNPYFECKDINECAKTKDNNICGTHGVCKNTRGGYSCSCQLGYKRNGNSCQPTIKYAWILAMIGTISGLMFLFGCLWGLRRQRKRRMENKLKKKYFKNNGGLLLQQQLYSSEDTIENTKLFTSKELEKATDHYNENRVLGRGGQGTVYKGMLRDGRIVAVKKSKLLDSIKVNQFVNEIRILSKINHRNVVKILGCCLETEFPLLVYEFVPNGTLFQYIHDQNEQIPFSWDMRMQIATEVAGALSYLHSAASVPIYHRDIKSTNILLDGMFRAKVADFGISMSVAIDKTHKTTMVRGTFGYLDPEYFQTNQFTEKSDVYSFGVVLVEILTGLEPILSISEEEIGLAAHFVMSMENHCFFNIVDARIVELGRKEEIMAVANLARRCLNLNGKKRPTMKAVAVELERIRISRGAFLDKLATKRMNTVIPNFWRGSQLAERLFWTNWLPK